MGKPLISDAQMLALYETMLRLRDLDQGLQPPGPQQPSRAAGIRPTRQVALLAATLLQLRPGDTLLTATEDPLAAAVLAYAQETTFTPEHQANCRTIGAAVPTVAAGHALAQTAAAPAGDNAPITVALLQGESAVLQEAMSLASEVVLPLLLIVQSGAVAVATPLESLPNVEVVRVDADDAVACCRMMQESLLRTRNRWGSVVLQAVTLPGATDPIIAFEGHLRRRNLSFAD